MLQIRIFQHKKCIKTIIIDNLKEVLLTANPQKIKVDVHFTDNSILKGCSRPNHENSQLNFYKHYFIYLYVYIFYIITFLYQLFMYVFEK